MILLVDLTIPRKSAFFQLEGATKNILAYIIWTNIIQYQMTFHRKYIEQLKKYVVMSTMLLRKQLLKKCLQFSWLNTRNCLIHSIALVLNNNFWSLIEIVFAECFSPPKKQGSATNQINASILTALLIWLKSIAIEALLKVDCIKYIATMLTHLIKARKRNFQTQHPYSIWNTESIRKLAHSTKYFQKALYCRTTFI